MRCLPELVDGDAEDLGAELVLLDVLVALGEVGFVLGDLAEDKVDDLAFGEGECGGRGVAQEVAAL